MELTIRRCRNGFIMSLGEMTGWLWLDPLSAICFSYTRHPHMTHYASVSEVTTEGREHRQGPVREGQCGFSSARRLTLCFWGRNRGHSSKRHHNVFLLGRTRHTPHGPSPPPSNNMIDSTAIAFPSFLCTYYEDYRPPVVASQNATSTQEAGGLPISFDVQRSCRRHPPPIVRWTSISSTRGEPK